MEKLREPEEKPAVVQKPPPKDLERCPRCGYRVEEILWGSTDCPNCGLHFECC